MKSYQAIIVCGVLIASSAQAQRARVETKPVPPNLRPPAGMCRVWLDDVPPGRQPAPTDCASALRNRPTRGQVLFGDDYARPDSAERNGDQPLKGVAPLPKGMDSRMADSAHAGHKPDDPKKKVDTRKSGGRRADSTEVTDPGDIGGGT